MNATAKQRGKAVKYRGSARYRANGRRNGYVDVVSPATVSEIQKTLGVMKPAPAHKSGAFSVLELIVVIVIVSMLLVLSMILPRLARSGPSAKVDRISCVNNLKQLGTAYHLWADDHNGRFPASASVTNDGWMEFLTNADQGFRCWTNFAIMKYELGQSPLIIVCPSDERRPRGEGFFGSSENGRGFADSECNLMVSYFVGVSANLGNPQSLLASDRNIENGVEPAEDYGYSLEPV